MNVLIDTNAILDAILKRTPFDVDAYKILKLADEKKLDACISSSSVTDIYYIISKYLSYDERIKAIKALFNIVDVVSVTKSDIEKAMVLSEFKDLEDALQMQCLKKIKGDFIITRDEELAEINEKIIRPKDFLKNWDLGHP